MFTSRAAKPRIFAALLIGVAIAGVSVGASADEKEDAAKPCVAKKFATPQVEKACKEGGQKAAKDMMKDLVKKAKAKGEDIKCKTCHKNLKDYEQTADAVDKLKKLL